MPIDSGSFPPPTYRFYSTDEVATLLGEAGFAAVEMRTAVTGPDLRIAVARARGG